MATFVVPEVEEATTARFEVTLTDPDGLTSSAEVEVAFNPAEGCGCASGSSPGSVLAALVMLGMMWRRRFV